MVIIREIKEEEYGEVALMHNHILALHAELLPAIFREVDSVKIEDVVAEIENYVKGSGVIYVAKLEGRLVGYTAARVTELGGDLRWKKLRLLYWDAIYVDPSERSLPEQIAEKLYEEVREYAKKKSLKVIAYDFWLENGLSFGFCRKLAGRGRSHDQIRRFTFI